MKKFLFIILISIFFANETEANNNVKIEYNINLILLCQFEKVISKNIDNDYKTYDSSEIENNNLQNLKIVATKPNILHIIGLSGFLNNTKDFEVKIVNNDVILFRALDKKKKYSESGVLDRRSGELMHEITRNIKSENMEKDILFYTCKKTI